MIRYRCLGHIFAGTGSRLDPGVADRLLCGDPVAPEHRDLATVLSVAAAASQPAELRGRSAAMAAFRAAAALPMTTHKRQSTVRSALVKMLTMKTALLAALAIGTGGVAIAAGAGIFSRPSTSHTASQPATPSSAAPTPTTPDATPPASPTSPAPSHAPSARRTPPAPPTVTATGSPSMVVLCRAYFAVISHSVLTGDAGDIDVRAGLDSPAFQPLIAAAGSRAAVVPFCVGVLSHAAHDPGAGGPPITDPHGSRGNWPGQPADPAWPPHRSNP